ncbi:Uncharacterised protein [Legionella pneumophila]|nr:Uncharacterised protein [Legionella pneumophila]
MYIVAISLYSKEKEKKKANNLAESIGEMPSVISLIETIMTISFMLMKTEVGLIINH